MTGESSLSGKSGALLRIVTMGLFLAFMVLPVVATALFSVSVRWDRTIFPEGVTLDWWAKVLSERGFQRSVTNSLSFSIATALASLALVAPTAFWVHTRLPRAKPLLEVLTILPFGFPAVVLALGLIRLYSPLPLPVVNTPFMLVSSYVVITLPFMYRAVMNSLEALDTTALSNAARSLGANDWQIFRRVILPNIRGGMLSGSLLVFSAAFSEFALANALVGTRLKTLPIYLVEFTRFDARQASALALISFTAVWLVSMALLSSPARRTSTPGLSAPV
ncbi:ABC transporter permease [Devosia sp.]|uniref:ABC transporter permease n=1 Tax=Devosia sp. TaxID=1871048 RepID=UPI001AC292F3|nr:ABC transporter permease [Devosia sp.]MBN9334444.1 ABC transporter permease [Devosia sp.]